MTRVLVVEDEDSFSDAISYLLRKEGFEVAVCSTGPDALETFDRTGADLVLLDLMLPGLPGSEVCRSLRDRSNVPVIMLTAKDSEIDKVVGLELGADDYVTKPFGTDELLARLRAIMRRSADAAGDPELHIGDVVIDLADRRVDRAGERVHLTPIEFDLLRVLASHQGRLVTQRQLLKEVWGPEYGDETHYLRVHVAHIRAKLEPDPSRPQYLITEPGVGYRLMDPTAS